MLSNRRVSTDLFHMGQGTDVFAPTDQSDQEINQLFAIREIRDQTREQNKALLAKKSHQPAPKNLELILPESMDEAEERKKRERRKRKRE